MEYILSDDALSDLDDIAAYYLEVRPQFADVLLAEFEVQFRFVAKYPGIGAECDHLHRGMRRTNVRDYLVFHWHTTDGTMIMRVLHGARDIDSAYFDESTPRGTP